MELKDYLRRPPARQALHQEMPDVWRDRLPTAEEIWVGGQRDGRNGWVCESTAKDKHTGEPNSLMRHFRWHLSDNFPPVLREMMDHHDCEDISMFIGHCAGANNTLSWHFDDYYVWAFNIEGVTEWDWFRCQTGEVETFRLEPGYIITMPLGVSHRVRMISEHRTSISIITRFGATTPRVPKE